MSSQQSELDEARRRKLRELEMSIAQQGQQEDNGAQEVAALEMLVKSRLTPEAAERYNNLKIAYPDKAMQVLGLIGQALRDYKIPTVTDAQLKELLQKMTPEKKEFKMTRK